MEAFVSLYEGEWGVLGFKGNIHGILSLFLFLHYCRWVCILEVIIYFGKWVYFVWFWCNEDIWFWCWKVSKKKWWFINVLFEINHVNSINNGPNYQYCYNPKDEEVWWESKDGKQPLNLICLKYFYQFLHLFFLFVVIVVRYWIVRLL